jgi:hypothetical protein
MIMALALLLLSHTEAFAPPSSRRFAAVPTSSFTSMSKPTAIKKDIRHSSLQMVSPGVAVAAITGVITGGLFAGSLHAISGESNCSADVMFVAM